LYERPIVLTAVEFDLLLALARVPGRVKSREQLLLEVADRDFEAFDPDHRCAHLFNPAEAGRRCEVTSMGADSSIGWIPIAEAGHGGC
jgi:hypothetical protein